jgi:hypothetical protein
VNNTFKKVVELFENLEFTQVKLLLENELFYLKEGLFLS